MNVIFLYGAQCVGKRTIARELAKLTKYKVIDNHIHTPLVLQFYPNTSKYYWELKDKIRKSIFETALDAKEQGLILTGVCDSKSANEKDLDFVKFFKKDKISFFHLVCSEEERKKRIVSEGRLDKITRTIKQLRSNSVFYKMKGRVHPTIDVTKISAKASALKIFKILNN